MKTQIRKTLTTPAILLSILMSTSLTAAYDYRAPLETPDVSWFVLGNSTGQMIATELGFGLPIISSLWAPASADNIIARSEDLRINYLAHDYVSGPFGRKANWGPWAGDWQNVNFEDGMQPAVSYMQDTGRVVEWPMDMSHTSREWVEEANVLRTVMTGAGVELTTEDFVCSDRTVLVRIFTVKNVSASPLSATLFHYVPMMTSSCTYDAASDCLLFTNNQSQWWVMGSDSPSSGHQCGTKPGARADVGDGVLSNAGSSSGSEVDGVLSYDSPVMAPGETFSVTIYFGWKGPHSGPAAAQAFTTDAMSSTGPALMATTLGFWRDWFATGNIPQTDNPKLTVLIRRLLMVIKASIWDNGGLSTCPAYQKFYTRNCSPIARSLAVFGFMKEAKEIILAKQAYAMIGGLRNFDLYNPAVRDIIDAGFSSSTTFRDKTEFSVDDPALMLFTIGEIWRLSEDQHFAEQTWPFVKYLIGLGERDMGSLGTIAQNNGFQDDMLKWAFWRGDEMLNGEAGIECSYWNMMWVAALETAADVANSLGHTSESAHYTSLASGIRNALETTFWNEQKQRYPYFYDPTPQSSYNGNTRFEGVAGPSGGEFVFPTPGLVHGLTMPYFCHYADNAHTQASFQAAKAILEPLPEGDLIMANSRGMAMVYARFIYAQAVLDDPTIETNINWLVKNIPLAGMPEFMPWAVRATFLWSCGESLCAIHAYLNQGTAVGEHSVRESDGRTTLPLAALQALQHVTVLDVLGRQVWSGTVRNPAAVHAVPGMPAAGAYVVQTTSGARRPVVQVRQQNMAPDGNSGRAGW